MIPKERRLRAAEITRELEADTFLTEDVFIALSEDAVPRIIAELENKHAMDMDEALVNQYNDLMQTQRYIDDDVEALEDTVSVLEEEIRELEKQLKQLKQYD